ncbi:hypothetical protein [Caballeronia novacaledonica]|uniref:Uncharacterized protein n=1 Tax=Caballeronia novacaledonica TaxID=1544861 RepID=A0AA37IGJ7_9BURK|nr:hypothetical protein [Caballeronia novacaledonica]GJH28943.1 hypothetical protein CBA19CS42_30525 [Caballeronia novacaledonica]
MPDTSNLYDQLKDALTQFKSFIDTNTAELKPAIAALKPIVPQVGDLLNKLISLMGELKTAINNIDVGAIPGLDKVSTFTTSITTLLQTAESLLPSEKSAIDDVLSAASVVTGLPSLSTVKKDILDLIDAIIGDLNALNS